MNMPYVEYSPHPYMFVMLLYLVVSCGLYLDVIWGYCCFCDIVAYVGLLYVLIIVVWSIRVARCACGGIMVLFIDAHAAR